MLEEAVRKKIHFEPTPDWVTEMDFVRPEAKLPHYKTEPGFYTWLVDDQIKLEPDKPHRYHRYVEEVCNLSSLHYLANIKLNFDPHYNDLYVHHVRIHRGEAVIDIDIKSRFLVMRRERSFERLVLDGAWTLAVTLPDVRVGDLVDVAITISGDPAVFKGEFSVPMILQSGVHWDHRRVRYLMHPDQTLHLHPFDHGWVEPKVIERDDQYREIVFVDHDIAPASFEYDMPPWVNPLRGVWASSLETWEQVADLMRAPFEGDEDYPEGLLQDIETIKSKHDNDKDRTVAAVHFVQTHIRYFAFAFGEGGFVPRSLKDIYADRIGDCKDVSKLIVAMLHKMGIEAYPALVDFGRGPNLINIPPRIGAFGHAISCAVIDGKTYWFEGTSDIPQYGDLEHMSQRDLGYALILKPKSSLVRMIEETPPLEYEVRELITLPKTKGQPTEIEIDYIYRGAAADAVRTQLEYQSLYSFIEDRCALFSYIYGMNMCAIPAMTDDRKLNELVVKTTVTTDDPWRRTQNRFEKEFMSPESAFGYVIEEPAGRRTYPFAMGTAREGKITTVVRTDYDVELPTDSKQWDFGGLKLFFDAKITPEGYEAVRRYVVTRDHLKAHEKMMVDQAYDDISTYDRLSVRVLEKSVTAYWPSFAKRVAVWAGIPLLAIGVALARWYFSS